MKQVEEQMPKKVENTREEEVKQVEEQMPKKVDIQNEEAGLPRLHR